MTAIIAQVEAFKSGQDPANALHSKFGLKTGEPVSSLEGYNHLQIDVVSLFLLFLVQTVSSGLKIIYCPDEVAFVQNLVTNTLLSKKLVQKLRELKHRSCSCNLCT